MERAKPLLIYDGDCNFCRKWIARWQIVTKESVDYAPFQEVGRNFPQISQERFESSVQLIDPSGQVFQGAEAVFRTLACSSDKEWLLWLYRRFPGFKLLSETIYRLIARNRKFFSYVTHLLWGKTVGPSTYRTSTSFFFKFLGFIYLIAFVSLGVQILGLIGSQGILPAKSFLASVAPQLGTKKYWVLPTLCWFDTSDQFLIFLCSGGILLSLFVIIGILPSLVLFLLWFFYLSIMSVSRDFLSFQWDILLLEIGFLAIFLAPLRIFQWRKSNPNESEPKIILWLLKWLLFRLMFSSGVVKLTSGDPTWRNLTALNFHYETQPLPTWIGWYAHQLPAWFQKFSNLVMFGVELVIPFFIFAPRKPRLLACLTMIAFQLLIMLTGNYCFFNLLAIALCILLIDDAFFEKWENGRKVQASSLNKVRSHIWPQWVAWPLAVIIFFASLVPLTDRVSQRIRMPILSRRLYGLLYTFNIVNGYGLFAVMTTTRPEIIVEGSNDGITWLPYEFKYKAGDLKGKPRFNEPHQPRLDWQMWFAALGNYQSNPWFINFCVRLLEGSPSVLKLLQKNPFPDAPPRYIHAVVYLYHFTNFAEKRENGTWWKREFQGLYCPILSLK